MISPLSGNAIYLAELLGRPFFVDINVDGGLSPSYGLNAGTPSSYPILPSVPEPLAALVGGLVGVGAGASQVLYAVAVSGNVYYIPYNFSAPTGVSPWSFVPAGNVGFGSVITGISSANITTPIDDMSSVPADYLIGSVVVGAKGQAARQTGQDPTTFFTTWEPLILTPNPVGDDLIMVYG